MPTALRTSILCALLSLSLSSPGQQKPSPFVKQDASVLVLDHVRLIDGTGAAPQEDMRIAIAAGKITAVSAANANAAYPPNVAITSTLPILETFAANRPPMERESAALKTLTLEAANDYLARRAAVGQHGSDDLFTMEMRFERAFVAAGGLLMAGCDPTGYGGVVPGFGDQRNIELLVEAGFTPVQAIQIATQNGAKYMGKDAVIGSIAPGKAAGIVVLGGNPAEKIENVEKVELVFKDGIGYDPSALIQSVRGLVGLR
jgi:hypothetical protein